MNRSKKLGSAFESACVRYLRKRLDDDRIERRALHGNKDMGDIHGLVCHGYRGIVEAKRYEKWSKADLERWKAQTVIERGNADADFALLIVHKAGCGDGRFGDNHCYLQVRDLERVMGGTIHCLAGDAAKRLWVCADLETVCRWMADDVGDEMGDKEEIK